MRRERGEISISSDDDVSCCSARVVSTVDIIGCHHRSAVVRRPAAAPPPALVSRGNRGVRCGPRQLRHGAPAALRRFRTRGGHRPAAVSLRADTRAGVSRIRGGVTVTFGSEKLSASDTECCSYPSSCELLEKWSVSEKLPSCS